MSEDNNESFDDRSRLQHPEQPWEPFFTKKDTIEAIFKTLTFLAATAGLGRLIVGHHSFFDDSRIRSLIALTVVGFLQSLVAVYFARTLVRPWFAYKEYIDSPVKLVEFVIVLLSFVGVLISPMLIIHLMELDLNLTP